MMQASEARNERQRIIAEDLANERKKVETIISNAIAELRSFCWLGFGISHECQSYLEKLGYTVKRQQGLPENPESNIKEDTCVSW